jgi:hypothetical protein
VHLHRALILPSFRSRNRSQPAIRQPVQIPADSDDRRHAENAVGNELATSLSLRLTRFDLDAGGLVEGEFDATFPSATLTGTFSAFRCAPL